LSTWFGGQARIALLEPVDTRQSWKGEAASASLIQGSPVAALPTSSAGYWSPSLTCDRTQAPPRRRVPSGAIFLRPHLLKPAYKPVITEDTNFSHPFPLFPFQHERRLLLRQPLPNAALPNRALLRAGCVPSAGCVSASPRRKNLLRRAAQSPIWSMKHESMSGRDAACKEGEDCRGAPSQKI
jgi:hypothetical protein